jgi:hypothetical protein
VLSGPASGHISGVLHTWNKHFRPLADARYERPLYALVEGDGTLIEGRGVASASRFTTGTYDVSFTRPVVHCALIAQTSGIPDVTVTPGEASAYVPQTSTPRWVRVHTYTSAGAFADRIFALHVTC